MRNLGALSGLVVIDEIQRRPELFEILRVLSASPSLVKGISESLAGRVGFSGFGRIRSARNRLGKPGLTLAQRRIPTLLSGP